MQPDWVKSYRTSKIMFIKANSIKKKYSIENLIDSVFVDLFSGLFSEYSCYGYERGSNTPEWYS